MKKKEKHFGKMRGKKRKSSEKLKKRFKKWVSKGEVESKICKIEEERMKSNIWKTEWAGLVVGKRSCIDNKYLDNESQKLRKRSV